MAGSTPHYLSAKPNRGCFSASAMSRASQVPPAGKPRVGGGTPAPTTPNPLFPVDVSEEHRLRLTRGHQNQRPSPGKIERGHWYLRAHPDLQPRSGSGAGLTPRSAWGPAVPECLSSALGSPAVGLGRSAAGHGDVLADCHTGWGGGPRGRPEASESVGCEPVRAGPSRLPADSSRGWGPIYHVGGSRSTVAGQRPRAVHRWAAGFLTAVRSAS